MSFSKQKKTRSTSTPVFHETWLPGQKEAAGEFLGSIRDIYRGDVGSPVARMLQQITGESAMRETAQQRKAITGTRGLTAPARAKAISGLGGAAVSAMARVPQTIWQQAAEALQQYVTTPPTVAGGTVSTTTGGGGSSCGICFIFKAFNEGFLEEDVRLFRDTHYYKGGFVDEGYRWMSTWLVPMMRHFSFIKHLAHIFMVWPLSQYARWCYRHNAGGFVFYSFRIFWPNLWRIIGRIKNAQIR